MKTITSLLLAAFLLVLPFGSLAGVESVKAAEPAYSGYPTFSIASVVKDTSVTIKAVNLPASDQFRVRMGKIGTKGIGGVVAGDFSSGTGGTKTLTFTIPDSLKGLRQIAIRFDSTTGSGYFAYNWFWNSTTGTGGTTGYRGYPTFSIVSVVRNKTVTIKAINLPANDNFQVKMNKMGTRGINGAVVGSFASGTGGTKTLTFPIPEDLKGLTKIAIRFDSTTGSGYFAYNWFWNNTTP